MIIYRGEAVWFLNGKIKKKDMKEDKRTEFTRWAFDTYMVPGDAVEFSEIVAAWNLIDPELMHNKVNKIKGGYSAYLQTIYWKTVADEVKRRAGNKCQICNSDEKLNVHHRSYEHRGVEVLHMNDLVCICNECHAEYHNKVTRKMFLDEKSQECSRLKIELKQQTDDNKYLRNEIKRLEDRITSMLKKNDSAFLWEYRDRINKLEWENKMLTSIMSPMNQKYYPDEIFLKKKEEEDWNNFLIEKGVFT